MLERNPEAPCWYHAYEFARDAFTNLIIATYLKENLSKEELKIVNKYIKKMHKKFIKPEEKIKKEFLCNGKWRNSKFSLCELDK